MVGVFVKVSVGVGLGEIIPTTSSPKNIRIKTSNRNISKNDNHFFIVTMINKPCSRKIPRESYNIK